MAIDKIDENLSEENKGSKETGDIKSLTSGYISKNIQLVSKIYNELGAEFRNPYMIKTELKGKNHEYTKISVTNPTLAQRSEPEIAITVRPNGNAILKLNPYNRYESTSFTSDELSPDKVFSEVKNVKYILNDGKPDKNSILRTTIYPSPHTFAEEEHLYEEQLQTGYTKNYNSILAKEGEITANKFYEEHAKYITK